jgi:hypothetical protein
MTQKEVLRKLRMMSAWTNELLANLDGEAFDTKPTPLPQCYNVECHIMTAKGAAQKEAIKRLHTELYNVIGEYV